MYTRKMALTFARRFRTCPGPEILQKTEYEMQIQHHFSICPYCAMEEPEADLYFQILAKKLDRLPGDGSTCVSVGDIRPVKSEYGIWHDGFYYHPPTILVVDILEDLPHNVLVAQIYDDLLLAGEGDLIVCDAKTGAGDLFIECWNMYMLAEKCLGPSTANLDHEIVAAVKAMVGLPENVPEWAPLCVPMTEHDPRIYFRELEIKVGLIMSDRAAGRAGGYSEDPDKSLDLMPPEILQLNLRRCHSGITWQTPPETVSQVLALARLPESELPLAAQDDREKTIPVMCCCLEGNAFSRIFFLSARINDVIEKGQAVTCAGQVIFGEKAFENSRLRAFQVDKNHPETEVQTPDKIKWDQDNGFFLAVFRNFSVPNSRLVLVIVDLMTEKTD